MRLSQVPGEPWQDDEFQTRSVCLANGCPGTRGTQTVGGSGGVAGVAGWSAWWIQLWINPLRKIFIQPSSLSWRPVRKYSTDPSPRPRLGGSRGHWASEQSAGNQRWAPITPQQSMARECQ